MCAPVLQAEDKAQHPQSKQKEEQKRPGEAFMEAAKRYIKASERATEAAKQHEGEVAAWLKELAENFKAMADIKRQAAKKAREQAWGKIDWKQYKELEKANEKLLEKLDAALKGKRQELKDLLPGAKPHAPARPHDSHKPDEAKSKKDDTKTVRDDGWDN